MSAIDLYHCKHPGEIEFFEADSTMNEDAMINVCCCQIWRISAVSGNNCSTIFLLVEHVCQKTNGKETDNDFPLF